ncbi:hypothetical protein [Paenibacillus ehimensis]|uniref:hypothetical protein n=1 Tax=Paenibacillus ehimensis TaxID=79264 RepID=UPI000FDC8983|nr:hypothetical protein [Paenibacillus ehimensis]
MDFSKKNNWTVEMLEKTLVLHTVIRPDEWGNFDLLWRAKFECEKSIGGIIRPAEGGEVKEWITVYKHNGYQIEVLNGAEAGDPMGYRLNPPLPEHAGT